MTLTADWFVNQKFAQSADASASLFKTGFLKFPLGIWWHVYVTEQIVKVLTKLNEWIYVTTVPV